jgi:mRNA-degrading endonuclease RelE of RelBE toxin-antitoxin system
MSRVLIAKDAERQISSLPADAKRDILCKLKELQTGSQEAVMNALKVGKRLWALSAGGYCIFFTTTSSGFKKVHIVTEVASSDDINHSLEKVPDLAAVGSLRSRRKSQIIISESEPKLMALKQNCINLGDYSIEYPVIRLLLLGLVGGVFLFSVRLCYFKTDFPRLGFPPVQNAIDPR